MHKTYNELLEILWDTNGYDDVSESRSRILNLFQNLANTSSNTEDFEKKIEYLRVVISDLPEKEIKFFEDVLKIYKSKSQES